MHPDGLVVDGLAEAGEQSLPKPAPAVHGQADVSSSADGPEEDSAADVLAALRHARTYGQAPAALEPQRASTAASAPPGSSPPAGVSHGSLHGLGRDEGASPFAGPSNAHPFPDDSQQPARERMRPWAGIVQQAPNGHAPVSTMISEALVGASLQDRAVGLQSFGSLMNSSGLGNQAQPGGEHRSSALKPASKQPTPDGLPQQTYNVNAGGSDMGLSPTTDAPTRPQGSVGIDRYEERLVDEPVMGGPMSRAMAIAQQASDIGPGSRAASLQLPHDVPVGIEALDGHPGFQGSAGRASQGFGTTPHAAELGSSSRAESLDPSEAFRGSSWPKLDVADNASGRPGRGATRSDGVGFAAGKSLATIQPPPTGPTSVQSRALAIALGADEVGPGARADSLSLDAQPHPALPPGASPFAVNQHAAGRGPSGDAPLQAESVFSDAASIGDDPEKEPTHTAKRPLRSQRASSRPLDSNGQWQLGLRSSSRGSSRQSLDGAAPNMRPPFRATQRSPSLGGPLPRADSGQRLARQSSRASSRSSADGGSDPLGGRPHDPYARGYSRPPTSPILPTATSVEASAEATPRSSHPQQQQKPRGPLPGMHAAVKAQPSTHGMASFGSGPEAGQHGMLQHAGQGQVNGVPPEYSQQHSQHQELPGMERRSEVCGPTSPMSDAVTSNSEPSEVAQRVQPHHIPGRQVMRAF